ncbi:hypothetical protein PINS_up007089 [Pythium insidiosum]|nr:hypothetical protein PINS_up007089 [Pythium insidiosum]
MTSSRAKEKIWDSLSPRWFISWRLRQSCTASSGFVLSGFRCPQVGLNSCGRNDFRVRAFNIDLSVGQLRRRESQTVQRMFNVKDKLWCLTPVEAQKVDLNFELALRIVQASKPSNLVATVRIKRLLVAVIVANWWLNPPVHFFWRSAPLPIQQLACISLDNLLDVVYFMVIPMAIFCPHWRDIQVDNMYSFLSRL